MSTTPESGSSDLGLDLDLHFLPAWAQKSSTENQYAEFETRETDRPPRRGDGPDRRGPRRSQNYPPRRDQAGRGEAGPKGPPNRAGNRPRPGPDGRFKREPTQPAPPPIELAVSFIPEEKGVESLARQIRLTGRAYPLFDIAFLILKKPERYNVRLDVIKKPDGQPAQPLFVCDLDETLWLSEQEAMDHALTKHFATFYQIEKTPADPPKGTYTFVAQCGMSGTILGPPNYHDHQNKIRKLHQERYSRVPFEVFKSRIKIVKDEAIVKKWLEDQSWKTEYICLNVPETVKLPSREEVERHFRQTHLPNVVKQVENYTLSGAAAQSIPLRPLQSLVRRNWDEQMRFPLKVVNVLSQQFAGFGLQFFKVNKTFTHVAVARPRFLDLETTPVSEGVRRIVDYIHATPNCTRRKLLEALAPNPEPAATATSSTGDGAPADATSAATPPPGPQNPEAAIVTSNLHWLIHEGHVIEFASGLMELAKRPPPKPVKQERAPATAAPEPEAASASLDANASAAATPSEVQAGYAGADAVSSPDPTAEQTPGAVDSSAPLPDYAPASSAAAGPESEVPAAEHNRPAADPTTPTPQP